VANHDSAIKAHRQSEERRLRNRQYRTRLRHALKDLRASIAKGDAKGATSSMSATVSLIDKMVGKGVLHDNAAGRYKSRLAKQLTRLTSPAA
jgi:small subunit ribosomal protein S20